MGSEIFWWDLASTHFAIVACLGIFAGCCLKVLFDEAQSRADRKQAVKERREDDLSQQLFEVRSELAAARRREFDRSLDLVVWANERAGALPMAEPKQLAHAA